MERRNGGGATVAGPVPPRRPPVAHVVAAGAPMITYANWRHRCTAFVALWPEPFLEVDGAGIVIEWNPRAEEVFGWRRHEVVGRPAAETVLPAGLGDPIFLDAAAGPPAPRPAAHGAGNGLHRRFELVHREGHRIASEGRLFVTGQGPPAASVASSVPPSRRRGPPTGPGPGLAGPGPAGGPRSPACPTGSSSASGWPRR